MTKANAMLEERPIVADSPECDAFLELYRSAFPEEERIDPDFLLAATQAPACTLMAYYDADAFCGFTFELDLSQVCYVMFLAVNDKVRSRGYGTRILSHIKSHAHGKPIALDVEPLDPLAPNAEQRERRMRFYERNGFSDTGYQIVEGGAHYTVLSAEGYDDIQAIKADFVRLSSAFEAIEFVRA